MSNFGNGILGTVQNQASAKGKAGHAKTSSLPTKGGDFASTVASVAGRGADGGRKGAGPSISAGTVSTRQVPAEQPRGTQTKTSHSDLSRIAEVLSKASAEPEQKTTGKAGAEPGLKADAETDIKADTAPGQKTGWVAGTESGAKTETATTQTTSGKAVPEPDVKLAAEFPQNMGGKADAEPGAKIVADPARNTGKAHEEKAAIALVTAKPDQKVPVEMSGENKAVSDEVTSEKSDGMPASVDDTGGKTDAGNLLELLAVPTMTPQVAAHGVAAVDGGKNGADQSDDRLLAALNARTDSVSADAAASNADDAVAGPVDDAANSGADQLFRLIRADGKGRQVDMSISADGERAAVRDANPTNGAKAETVTVLDARRYIGLAETGNSVAVTSAIAQDPEWATSLSSTGGLAHSSAAATGKVVNTLKIQMHPIELGLVTATMRLHGDELVVSLQVQTAEAYRQLTDDQDAIVKALRDQGFAVDQVTVQLTPSDRGTSTQQGDGQPQQQQSQFSNQTQAREDGNGRQGSGEQAARNSGREDASHEGNTSENAPGLAGGQSLRSGGVYL